MGINFWFSFLDNFFVRDFEIVKFMTTTISLFGKMSPDIWKIVHTEQNGKISLLFKRELSMYIHWDIHMFHTEKRVKKPTFELYETFFQDVKYSISSLKFWNIFLWLSADSNYDLFFHYISCIWPYIVTNQIQGKSLFFVSLLFEIIMFVSKYYETLISFYTFPNVKRKKIFFEFFCFFKNGKKNWKKRGAFLTFFDFFCAKKFMTSISSKVWYVVVPGWEWTSGKTNLQPGNDYFENLGWKKFFFKGVLFWHTPDDIKNVTDFIFLQTLKSKKQGFYFLQTFKAKKTSNLFFLQTLES